MASRRGGGTKAASRSRNSRVRGRAPLPERPWFGKGVDRPLTCPSQASHPRPRPAAPLPRRRSNGHNSGAIARAPFDRGPRCGSWRRGEAAPAPALAPLGRGLGREHAPPLEQAQYPLSHGVLYSRWPTAVASRNLTPSAWALNGTAVGAARRSPTNTGTAASNTPSIMAQWKCRLALRYTASSASQRFMNRITVTPGTR
jgi:hypothetical protein